MNVFLTALRVVYSPVVFILAGIVLKKTGIIRPGEAQTLNGLIFKFMIPCTLFMSLYRADWRELGSPAVYLFVAIGTIAVYAVAHAVVFRKIKNRPEAATVVQGLYRSCYVLIGMPVALSVAGEQAAPELAALAAFVVPVNTVLAVELFERARSERLSKGALFLKIVKNPLILSVLAGLLANFFLKGIPEELIGPVVRIGQAATPLALVVLGSMLSLEGLRKGRKIVGWTVLFDLVVIPAVMLTLAALMGFRGAAMAAVLGAFAAPNDIVSAPFASEMGGDAQLASEIVAVSTIGSAFTIFAFTYILLSLGLV